MFVVISCNLIVIDCHVVQFIIGSSPTKPYCYQHSALSPGRILHTSGQLAFVCKFLSDFSSASCAKFET